MAARPMALLLSLPLWACSLITDLAPDQMSERTQPTCSDGLDNDGNGLVDCQELPCAEFSFCQERSEVTCADGLDNDLDGAIDCQDPGCCVTAQCQATKACGEQAAAACADGLDNNDNGRVDCNDFSCAAQAGCCTAPVRLLAETFSSANRSCAPPDCVALQDTCCTMAHAVCNPLDETRWVAWGVPRPRLTRGGVTPNQPCILCAASGLTSVQEIDLDRGVHLEFEADLAGDALARLSVGLAEQSYYPQSAELCGRVSGAFPLLVGLRLADGAAQAILQDSAQATAPAPGQGRRTYGFTVNADGTVDFALGGARRYTAPINVADSARRVRLVIQGWSARALVDNVFLGRNAGCRDPGAWSAGPAGYGPVLAPSADGFDSNSLTDPAALWDGTRFHLYYTGRSTSSVGSWIGHATSADGVTWERAPAPLVMAGVCAAALYAPVALRTAGGTFLLVYRALPAQGDPYLALATSADGGTFSRQAIVLRPGGRGSWDDSDVTAPALAYFRAPGMSEPRLHLWYAGVGVQNPIPLLGLATERRTGGYRFDKSGANPVLRPAAGAFEDRGVTDPWVLAEEDPSRPGVQLLRLWYVGLGWSGKSRINHAVSEDGTRWQRYPQNPVLDPALFGGTRPRGPTVVARWSAQLMWYSGSLLSPPAIGLAVNDPSP